MEVDGALLDGLVHYPTGKKKYIVIDPQLNMEVHH
jgi:hypothetical protein